MLQLAGISPKLSTVTLRTRIGSATFSTSSFAFSWMRARISVDSRFGFSPAAATSLSMSAHFS